MSTLWLHFTEMAGAQDRSRTPVLVEGEGAWVVDEDGHRYLDALSALYCVNVGYRRPELVEAAHEQLQQLSFSTNWSFAHPKAVELSSRIAELAPGSLNHSFFTLGGAESVESAWKLALQYHRLRGHDGKYRLVAREGAYHGTGIGALAATGIPAIKEPFEALLPEVVRAPRVYPLRADASPYDHAVWCAEETGRLIEAAGPETVAAVLVEPIQNSGGCLTPDPVYFRLLRGICDRHDVLLIADETITAWGRLGEWFGSQRLGFSPDIMTTAKGITSAYIPFGAVIASDEVFEPFTSRGVKFQHGYTFGGHPVGAAVALANIDVIEREGLLQRVRESSEQGAVRRMLQSWSAHPMAGEVRGDGYFFAIELVRDKDRLEPPTEEELAALSDFLPPRLRELGVICRAMNRGAPVIQFAPPLILTDDEIAFLSERVTQALDECAERILPTASTAGAPRP